MQSPSNCPTPFLMLQVIHTLNMSESSSQVSSQFIRCVSELSPMVVSVLNHNQPGVVKPQPVYGERDRGMICRVSNLCAWELNPNGTKWSDQAEEGNINIECLTL